MSSSERFSWSEPSKKAKKTSSESTYLNAPVGDSGTSEQVDMSQKHEHDIDLHPRVLPAPLFDKLVGGEDKAPHGGELPRIPIPFEHLQPHEGDGHDPHKLEQATKEAHDHEEGETSEEEGEDNDDTSTKKKSVAPPPIATQPGVAHSAVERLIEQLDEESEGAPKSIPEATDETEASPQETPPSEQFMPLESEPEGAMSAPEWSAPGGARVSEHRLATSTEHEPDEEPASPYAGTPPPPPTPPPTFGFDRPPEPERPPMPTSVPSGEMYMHHPALAVPERPAEFTTYAPPTITPESHQKALNEAEYYAEKRGLRRGLVAGFITGYVVKQFLANRKQRRFEAVAEQEMEQRNRQMAEMTATQTRMGEQLAEQRRQLEQYQYNQAPATHYERPAYPQPLNQGFERPAASAPVTPAAAIRPELRPAQPPLSPEQAPAVSQAAQLEQLQQQQAQEVQGGEQEVVLPPGWRLERRGWYSVVVDEHGREVQGALNYGEAFHREQRREQAPVATNAMSASGPMGGGGYATDMGAPAVNGILGSGQVDPAHTLQAGQPQPVDPNHRLPKRQNPVVATIANPVLWLAFALIVIAYFIAALL